MKKVRYGMIGFGGIAENRIAKEGFCADASRFQPHPLVTLVGVTDVNPDRKAAAARLGLNWYANSEDVFQDTGVDAVFIATNNKSHAREAMRALGHGKHCLIEKPMATTREEAERIVTLARERRLSLSVDHMMVHNAYNKRAAEIIRGGQLGTVNDVCLHMEFLYGATTDEAKSWRCDDAEELGGPLGDVASHCLYMAEFLLNTRIMKVDCTYMPKTLEIRVEDGAFIQFDTERGSCSASIMSRCCGQSAFNHLLCRSAVWKNIQTMLLQHLNCFINIVRNSDFHDFINNG